VLKRGEIEERKKSKKNNRKARRRMGKNFTNLNQRTASKGKVSDFPLRGID